MNIANFKQDYFPSKTQIKYVSLLGLVSICLNFCKNNKMNNKQIYNELI